MIVIKDNEQGGGSKSKCEAQKKVMIKRKQEVRSNTKSGKLSHMKELNKGDERETLRDKRRTKNG